MLISIIIPVYNVEKYLKKCLDSVLEQTYKELEVILIDDGSQDSSGRICDDYAVRYNNFTVVHKDNGGLGMARNTGIKYMHGEYVMFLDSDDYVSPTLVESLLNKLLHNHVDMCKGGFFRVTDSGQILSVVNYRNEIFEGDQARSMMLPRMIGSRPDRKDSLGMSVWGAIYKADIIKKHQLYFVSEREWGSEDLVFNVDYMQHADGACTVEDVGYFYRMNENSLTHHYRVNGFDIDRHSYLLMYEKLKELHYDDLTLLRLRRKFFTNIKGNVRQETGKKSGLSATENIKRISRICNDNIVRIAIKEYPINELGFRQRIFLKLIQKNHAFILFLLATVGIV